MEKDRFLNDYDKDADGRLDPQELLSWVVPNNQGIAQEEVSVTGLSILHVRYYREETKLQFLSQRKK